MVEMFLNFNCSIPDFFAHVQLNAGKIGDTFQKFKIYNVDSIIFLPGSIVIVMKIRYGNGSGLEHDKTRRR